MNFKSIIDELGKSSVFDLYRLYCAMSKMMEDPQKIAAVKKQLKPGMQVSYFEDQENRLIESTILEINRTRVLVLNHEDNKRWNIPFYWLNITNVNTDIGYANSGTGTLNKTNLKVNDQVGWVSSRDSKEMFSVVIKL